MRPPARHLPPERKRDRRGANALEFALVMPVLVLLTFAGMDYAWYFIAQQELQYATREATRAGAQTQLEEDPVAAAYERLGIEMQDGVVLPSLTVEATTDIVAGPAIRVRTHATVPPLLGFVPTPTELSAGSQLIFEQD
ncbi:MAG: pilus assembly protein [Deltaproteobacteria bacterium]|nr:pilus assembly protein [Deltaproteobacteria bacterium]MBW2255327.1 pilus assembly protein [Deltaproteobacteria bacterium]